MAEETNPETPDETKTPGDAAQKEPAPKEAAPTAEAAPKRPAPKKTAKPKKEQPAPTAGTPENLSLSTDEVEKPKVVKAKGSKNVHSGVAHVMATFNNTDGPWTQRSGSVGQRPGSRTRIRCARFAGDRARPHGDSRRYAGAAQRLSSAETTPRLTLSTF